MARSTRVSTATTADGSRGTTTSAGDAGSDVVGAGGTVVDSAPAPGVCDGARRADWCGEGSDEHAAHSITAATATATRPTGAHGPRGASTTPGAGAESAGVLVADG